MDAEMESSRTSTGLPAPRRECVPIMKASTNGCSRQQDSEEGKTVSEMCRALQAYWCCVCLCFLCTHMNVIRGKIERLRLLFCLYVIFVSVFSLSLSLSPCLQKNCTYVYMHV
jgi:hypothetical protein